MANLSKIMGKIMTFIPKTEGAAGKIRLSKLQLDEMVKHGEEEGKILQQLLSGTKNPTLDVAYKAKSNYSIAGIKLQDGKQVLGHGAVSVVNPGRSDAVIKYKVSAGENGKILSSNGFIDGGKPADAKDIAAGFTRRGGNVTADVSSGKAFGAHIAVNENEVIGLANKLEADALLRGYVQAKNKLQRQLDELMGNARQLLRGGSSTTPPQQTVQQAGKIFNAEEGLIKSKIDKNMAKTLKQLTKSTEVKYFTKM